MFIFTVGISGSGKSTYLNKHYSNHYITCPDNIRREITGDVSNMKQERTVWAIVYKRILENIRQYNLSILDATNVKVKSIMCIFDYLHENNIDDDEIDVLALIFPCDVDVSISRISNDIYNNVDRSKVPNDVVRKQYENYKMTVEWLTKQKNIKIAWV